MANSYLESALLAACPGLRDDWAAMRRAGATDDGALLSAVRLHAVGLLTGGRVVEFTRLAHTVERLLAEADPVLEDVLREQLVRPLAREVEWAQVPGALVAPHLGPRTRRAWSRARGGET